MNIKIYYPNIISKPHKTILNLLNRMFISIKLNQQRHTNHLPRMSSSFFWSDLQEAAQQDVVDVEVGESRQCICQNVHHLIAGMSS